MPKIAITKSLAIKAPIDQIYAAVRDFKQWPVWSPWLIADPDCEVKYAEDGCSYSWDGKVAGAGEMEITREDQPRSIDCKLTFLKPWKSLADVKFRFAEKGDGTEVSWSMDSSLPFFMFFFKGMMEGLIGMDYQRGLAMLKDYIETSAVPSKLDFSGPSSFAGFKYVGVKTRCPLAEIGPSMERDMAKLGSWHQEAGVEPAGKPFSIYHRWNVVKGFADYTIGFPVKQVPASLPADLVGGRLPDCAAYLVKHTGPYRHLGNAWSSGMMRGRAKVFRQNKCVRPFEIYESDPTEVAEDDVVTVVHFPAKM